MAVLEGESRAVRCTALDDRFQLTGDLAGRQINRALGSSNQLQGKLTWFWLTRVNLVDAKTSYGCWSPMK